MVDRDDHQVPRVVRKQIHDDERPLPPVENQWAGVGPLLEPLAEEAPFRLVTTDIPHPPRGPEALLIVRGLRCLAR